MTTKYGNLKNGDRIYLSGYLFEIRNLTNVSGTVRFEGHCTTDKRNDSIRGTMYDGGTYGAYDWVDATTDPVS